MNGSSPSTEDILGAIGESGYLMEQEVASIIEAIGYHVETNRAYQDLDESTSREIDIWAIRRALHDEQNKIQIFVEIICEAKNFTAPVVFLGRAKNAKDRNHIPLEFVFPIPNYQRARPDLGPNVGEQVPAFKHLALAEHHYYYSQNQKAVQFCKILRTGKTWKAEHGGIYDALFYPLVKAFQSRKNEVKKDWARDQWKTVWLFFPMVVVKGSLYYIDTMEKQPLPRIVTDVTFSRDVDSRNLKGRFMVDFVTQASLTDFITSKIHPLVDQLIKLANDSPELFHKETIR